MYRSKNRLGGQANTIGVVVDWLGDPYQATVCDGIEQGAAHAGANLLFFVGGALPASPQVGPPRHRLYELAGRHNIDGLIVLSSTVSHQAGPAAVQAFCAQFSGIPMCSVGMALADAPSVTVDNASGMRLILEHLVEHHAARRIAFISGPAENDESKIRLGVYREVLQKTGVATDEQLVVVGTFMMESGELAVRTLAKRLGPALTGLDAIVAANDNMAIGAMDELERMSIAVPERVIVTGFDDIEEARLTGPSLTTARQPLERLGLEAMRRVLQNDSHGGQGLELQIATELVVRQSCGCSTLLAAHRSAGPASRQRFPLTMMGQRDRIAAQIGRAARGRFSAAGSGWEQMLIGGLLDDLIAGASERFVVATQRFTQRLSVAGVDLNAMDDVLTALREEVIPLVHGESEKQRHAEDLFHTVRLSTSAALQRALGRTHLALTRWARTIAVVCNAISSATDYAELRARIREYLPQLGLRSCFVSIYDTPGDPSQARLIAASDATGAEYPIDSRPFRGRELLPPALATVEGQGRSFAILPLLGQQAITGHVLFEYTARHAFACGVLAEAIGIAVARAPGSAGSRSAP